MSDSKASCDSPVSRLRGWLAGEPKGPSFVTVYPTNRCNLVCSTCWQRNMEKLEFSHETSDERLLTLVDECADMGAQLWTIVGGGEPMLRSKAVLAMCERIRERGMNGTLQCNGTVFSDEDFRKLMDIGWERLAFSIDGPTREINDRVRSAGSFEKATGNFRRFSAMKRERGAEFPSLWFYTVVNRLNYDKLDDMVDLVHDCGCNGIQGGILVPVGPLAEELALSKEQNAEAANLVRRAAEHAHQIGLQEMLEWIIPNLDVPLGFRPKGRCTTDPGFEKVSCLEPWTSVVILPNGEVGPCCVFWDENAPTIQDHSFKEIWEGYMAEIRSGFLEDRFPPYCARCQHWLRVRTNQMLVELEAPPGPPKWSEVGTLKLVRLFSHKVVSSVGRNGLRGAIKRGREWLSLIRK